MGRKAWYLFKKTEDIFHLFFIEGLIGLGSKIASCYGVEESFRVLLSGQKGGFEIFL